MVRVRHQRSAVLGGTPAFPGLVPWLRETAAKGLGSYNTLFVDQVRCTSKHIISELFDKTEQPSPIHQRAHC
jgi:hypothetical protein